MNLTQPQTLIYDMEKFSGGAISVICGSMIAKGVQTDEKLAWAVNELYRLHDALRIRITEADGQAVQTVCEYCERDVEVLHFESKKQLEIYAERYAKEPLDMFGELCKISIVKLPDGYGILVKLHHLVCDAWTLSLIGTQFNKLLNGEKVESCSYIDYVESEAAYIHSKRYEKDKAFFLEQFKKCDEVTYLSEKQAKTLSAKRKTFVIEQNPTAELMAFANANSTSAFTVFMTALSAYISRTRLNAENFYIGTAVLNRTNAKEKNTAGMFINTVPVLINLCSEKSFAENLEEVESASFSVFRHQKYNYGSILQDLRSECHFGEKLYDVMLSYQNATIIGETDFESTWYHSGMQNESLQIHIDDRDGEGILKVHYDYQTEKFTEHEIDRLHLHIMNLLFDGIKNSGKKIYELDFLTEDEQQKLLFDFNDTAVDYPRDKCVHQLFEEQAAKTPDKTAVIACDKTLTYKELNEQANRIAHALIEKGVKQGDIVAFMLPRRSYLIAAMFGILKSGAAYMPIDPDYPQDRIEYMLEDSKAKFCVTEENINDLLSNSCADDPNIAISSENLCYCIYTSGSTGKPKGTLLTHSNVGNYVNNNNNNNNVVHWIIKDSYKNIVSVTTVGFDIFVTESLLPLVSGMKILLANEEQAKLQNKLNDLIKSNPADVMQTTPTKMKSLIADKTQLDYLKTVKVIILGGEALDHSLVEELKQITDAKIFNIYGPTEATVWVTNAEIKDTDITIGKPIANTQIYIVDKYTQPTPIGVTGELCIAGDGIGAGYLNRPELTAEKFIDNPFGKGKLYKTGDLAYWREDGNIVYVGRNDFQVKIRGLRIELGEIENAVSGVEGVLQSVVVVRKDETCRQLICAFYTEKEAVDVSDIKAVISKKLPKYMMPHIFTRIDEMPLTSSGKVNRKALPEVDLHNIDSGVKYIEPQTKQEKVLVSAIETVLGTTDKVSILDNFFDLGGDSLKAIELTSKLESHGYTVEIKTIFECENIRELAEKLTVKETAETKVTYGSVMPATPAQMRVYTAQSMQANSTLYNIPYVFQVKNLDIAKLKTAINKLIARHEALRTHFENQNGKIVQVIDESATVEVDALTTDDIQSFVRPFDLTKSPLLRVGYFENTVMIDIHHIIADGGTMPVFFGELNEFYMGRELKNDAVQYGEFAVTPVNIEDSEKYWLSVFDDELPVLELPTDFPRGEKQSFAGSAVYDTINIQLHNNIKTKCKEWNMTPYAFYMACFNILLSKFSGCEDMVVGMPVSGREAKYLHTIGMFVNTVALRSKPVGTKTVSDFMTEVKENSVSAIANQNYPFGELVKKLKIEAQGRNPLFDVMFAYQSEQMTDIIFGDEKAEVLPVPTAVSKCDFTFNIMPRDNDIVVMVEYCTDLFKQAKIQKFIDSFKIILDQALNENTRIKDISAVSETERQKLLFDFNDTAVDYPRDKCVHQLFEEQAAKTPDKTAVIAGDKTLTYKELNEQANRIAHSLIEKGVKQGDIVAFMLPRRSYLIAAMFGILKAGAAYMPIDPDYPQDRIEYMLEDSNAKFCVTEENINDLLNHSCADDPNIAISSENLCYCIYTSGSTGKPKGVLINHKNVINFCYNNNDCFKSSVMQNCDYVLAGNNVTFDITVQEIGMPLLNGKTILFSKDTLFISDDEFSYINNSKTNYALITTPTKLSYLLNDPKFVDSLKSFSTIMIGAEVLSVALYNRISGITDAKIFNGYGPTEITCGCLYAQVTNEDITIGQPIANTQIYIVDKYMQTTPIGVTGELCIAGDGVGAGYLNRPELTAEKFIDNPFGNGKLYKTGDLAYWREDGNIVYVGRNDFQVKIRGLRIELGEIENAVSGVEGVLQSVVVVRKDETGRQLICAFYTEKEAVDVSDIKAAVSKKLPKYMMPHIFTRIDEMPLTSSGKVNRKALPEVDLHNISNDENYVAPTTEMQKALCCLLADTLKTERVGLTDDFFDIGLDSLKAIEFISSAHSDGIYFPLQYVFDYPTVEKLCDAVNLDNTEKVTYNTEDFEEIHTMLQSNVIDDGIPDKIDMGDILLAGSTGFLGMHILAEYLECEQGKAYCLARGADLEQAKKRFIDTLKYYFDSKYTDLIGSRIVVICGDIEKENLGLETIPQVGTLINAAASVKHYGSYDYFKSINTQGVINAMNAAKQVNARFIHISTLSVSGNSMVDAFDGYRSKEAKIFSEKDLYIGQSLDNVYIRSKFEGECAVYREMPGGMKANVIRVGNLTNRASDMKFQPNYQSNAFLARVKAVLDLGAVPDYLMDLYSEFSPVDDTARGIIKIAQHFNDKHTVFHLNSHKVVYFDKFVDYAKRLNIKMEVKDEKSFAKLLSESGKNESTKYIYEALINDLDENEHLNYDSNIHIENKYTLDYLAKLGFDWSEIDFAYIKRYIEYFNNLGFLGGAK